MIGRFVIMSLWVAFIAAFFVRPVQAQIIPNAICFPSVEFAAQKAKEHGEVLTWEGINGLKIKMYLFEAETSFTIFVEDHNGVVCTSPALIGDKKPKGLAT